MDGDVQLSPHQEVQLIVKQLEREMSFKEWSRHNFKEQDRRQQLEQQREMLLRRERQALV